jgi:hypothetical protein
MDAKARFLDQLAEGIHQAKGDSFAMERARALAAAAWEELLKIGLDAFPCMTELEDLRFVYQWDEQPPVLTVMLWNDQLWQDMARVVVPAELAEG